MTSYFLTVEKIDKKGGGCPTDEKGHLIPWDIPDFYGFAKKEDAEKLQCGDRIVDYVAPARYGFAFVMEVEEWKDGAIYQYRPDPDIYHPLSQSYPFRVKVKVLCQIKNPGLMPKWQSIRPYLNWCKGMTILAANQTLRAPIRRIDKHDYDIIANAVCKNKEDLWKGE